MYAKTVNLSELHARDVEQTVAHFIKSTRKLDQRGKTQSVDRHQRAGSDTREETSSKKAAPSVLNQIVGKSLTKVDAPDYVYTFVPTRSLRQSMMTTVTNTIVVAPEGKAGEHNVFIVLDQEGSFVFNFTLEKQSCEPGSRREFIRSNNFNDMVFGYLCQSQDTKNTTLGFYRF